jgi:DNA-binding SARP family transcriptional activator
VSANGPDTKARITHKEADTLAMDQAPNSLSLRLFGPLDVRLSGEPLPRLRSKKGQWLLALLTLRHDAEVSRSWLSGLLWPDSSEAQGLASLRNSLMDLRRALGPEGHRLQSPSPSTLRLRLEDAEADVVAFDQALSRGDAASLERAVSLYRGPLLEGCVEEWVLQERQAREQAYLGALEQLAAEARERADLGAAERHLRLAVAVDATRETGQRALMQVLAESGNYAGALQTYRDLRLHLHREFTAEPDPETRALFAQIRAEARSRAQAPAREGIVPAVPGSGSGQSSPRPPVQELEIAHVLYMDFVGYSRVPLAQQPHLMAELQDLVRDTEEFRQAEAQKELICLPTGDGMALVFLRDPVAPIQCAMQIAREARCQPHLKLRMGLHSGPVYRVEDINANVNVAGGGINLAQRVMECGDAGHILLSDAVYALLGQVGDWPIHDIGVRESKHGERLHLYNLYTGELGNPLLPEMFRLAGQVSARRSAGESDSELPAPEARGRERIVLLYRHDAQPDQRVLQLLEGQLRQRGCQVFADRNGATGVEWAREIERQVHGADIVIPLLSVESMQSETLAGQVQIADEAARQQEGRPRLLPVRINYTGPLPHGPLAAILDPLVYVLWRDPGDDERLIEQLLDTLQEALPPVRAPRSRLEAVGGAVPLDSKFYIVRRTDQEFHEAIARHDSIVLVKGARQMGKTSLLGRGLEQARQARARVLVTDFQQLNAAHFESAEAFYQVVGAVIADQLELDVFPNEVWDSRLGSSMNFNRYIRRQVLGQIAEPIVWGLDEVEQLATYDFSNEVFGLLRSWHNQRVTDPTGPWNHLTLALAYATEAHLLINNIHQSPFNVGTRLTLEDFTLEQVADLNKRYSSPLKDSTEVSRFHHLVSGQPYLVRCGLQALSSDGVGIADLEAAADRENGIFGDHLRRILIVLARNSELMEVVRGVLQGRPCPTAESFYQLRSAGIVAGESARDVRPRCPLYAAYLKRHLL